MQSSLSGWGTVQSCLSRYNITEFSIWMRYHGMLQCVYVCVCVSKSMYVCVAFVRVEDASFVRSLLFRCIAVQESLLTWVASVWVCVCVKLESIIPVRRVGNSN